MATRESINRVIDIVSADDRRKFVIVSAPGKRNKSDIKVTDQLYKIVEEQKTTGNFKESFDALKERFVSLTKELGVDFDIISELDNLEKAIANGATASYAASRGEYLSAKLLSAKTGWTFIDAKDIVRFNDCGVFDPEYTNDTAKALLQNVKGRAVIPGFYGASDGGDIFTFSRGGSDITGAIVARATDAIVYENWTDVSGFLMADPRIVPHPREISSITYKDLPHDVSVGGRIMLDDGLISLRIESITDTDIVCTVENDGVIKTKKGVNVPGVHLSMPYMSQRDRDDILFGIEQGYDLISASFTRSAQDIMDIRHLLDEHNANIRIIAKIENQEGIDNIDEILSVADGIMVARGDMGVEIDYAEIPSIQKHLIDHAMQMGKICITATQMLDSMIVNPRPTRAEITDVANAIYDGTGAVMLSGETAAGKYPVEALKAMAMIAETTESDTNYESLCHHVGMDSTRLTISAAVSHAACTTASDISASAIITASKSGETARLLSRFRPDAPIIACVLDETTCRQMNVYRGVTPLLMDYAHSTDELISMSVKAAEDAGLIHSGDRVVVTAGVPVGVSGTTNMIKVHLVGDTLLTGIGINPGLNAKGEVCVCRNAEEAAKKFKAGQILVVPFTTNDTLPYMRQAAGIIAEEAGANSHSAIVGLTLGKPVIIGATHATRTLKDGMKISMDCARGVVQAMSE